MNLIIIPGLSMDIWTAGAAADIVTTYGTLLLT